MLSNTHVAENALASAQNDTPTQTRFNRRANTYENYAQVQQDMASWLAKWLPAAREGACCAALDLGAGSGTFTRHLAERCQNICALEAAPNMVARGQKNFPQADWQQGDAWTLQPLEHSVRKFGLITSASLLQWCPQPQQTLAHWAKLCSPGTRMLHGFYIEPTLWQWRKIFGSASIIDWRSAALWTEAFAQSDWQIIRSETSVRDYHFASALELARSLHRTGVTPERGSLPAGRFRSLLRQYDASFAATGKAVSAEKKTTATPATIAQAGVLATWAFFRIEVIRQ